MLVIKLRAPRSRRLGGQILLGVVLLAASAGLFVLTWSALSASGGGPWRFASGSWESTDESLDEAFSRPGAVRVGWQVAGHVVLYRDRLLERPPTDAVLMDLAVLPSREIVVVGTAGTVLRRARDGQWRMLTSGGPALRALAAAPTGVLYAAGDQGALVRIDGDTVTSLQRGPGPTITQLRVLADGSVVGQGPGEPGWGWFGWLALAGTAVILAWTTLALVGRLREWSLARSLSRALGPAHVRLIPTADGTRVLFAARRQRPTPDGSGRMELRVVEHSVSARTVVQRAEGTVSIPAGEGPLHLDLDLPVELPDGSDRLVEVWATVRFGSAWMRLSGETRPTS